MKLMRTSIAILSILALLCFSAWAQDNTRTLKQDAYKMWETLSVPKISPDGAYISYTSKASDGLQTLFVKSLHDKKARVYKKYGTAKFLKFKNRFVYQKGDTLLVESNAGDPVRSIEQVQRYEPLGEGRYLLTCPVDFYADTAKVFKVIDTDRWTERSFTDVESFSINPQAQKIVFSVNHPVRNQLVVYDLLRGAAQTIEFAKGMEVNHMAWSADGKSLTFLWKGQGNAKYADRIGYILDIDQPEQWSQIAFKDIRNGDQIHMSKYPRTMLSTDKKRIFFEVDVVTDGAESVTDASVEIWRQQANPIFPYENSVMDYKGRPKLGSIDLEQGAFSLLQKRREHSIARSSDDRYAFTLDFSPYEPFYLHQGEHYAIRLLDLQHHESMLLDSNISGNRGAPIFVEKLQALLYQKENDLILYDLESEKKMVINRNVPNRLSKCRACNHGIAISSDARFFYLFDEFDLWEVSVDGTQVKRLTFGRDAGIEYHFPRNVYDTRMFEMLEIDTKKGIFLEAENKRTGETGFARWEAKKGVETIVYGDMKYSFLFRLPDGKGYLYRQEDFDRSPAFVWQRLGARTGTVVVESNVHQSDYDWGRSEMVYYNTVPVFSSMVGREQNAALFYPANYQEGKKYPLIVSIYEDNTYMLNEYHNPGPSSFIDFNHTDYTLDGYFVINPNLRPRDPSNPGHSMLENLKAAVNYMKSTGMIDENRIGIYGHSFGGYEALFAATQMDDFATVVAGAAITDLVTDYFAHRNLLQGPSFYRTEWMQHAMKRNYFEIPELYHANSPFHHIDRIQAPILLWTGKDDTNVGWEQSVQFYKGMLRLQKECTLLVYPGEDHVLFKPDNLKDLDTRMKQWFGHFLKDEPKQPWMMVKE